MAKDPNRIYHEHNPAGIALKIFLAAVAVLVVFAAFLFIYFQRFIVFTPEGLKLDIAGYYAQKQQPEEPAPPASVDIIYD